jgi:hypothetical protein
MPPDIADLADGMWQRALKLAGEAARHDDNAARERLAQLQLEAELRARSFELREREYDAAARAREQALADSRDHLLSLMKTLGREQATLRAQETRIADLDAQVARYRRQLATLLAGAVAGKRAPRRPVGAAQRPKKPAKAKPRRAAPAKRARKGERLRDQFRRRR